MRVLGRGQRLSSTLQSDDVSDERDTCGSLGVCAEGNDIKFYFICSLAGKAEKQDVKGDNGGLR